jgi:hypothetical protein
MCGSQKAKKKKDVMVPGKFYKMAQSWKTWKSSVEIKKDVNNQIIGLHSAD